MFLEFFGTIAGEILLLFNNSLRTTKETQHIIITKISLLTLFEVIIAIYP